MHAGCQIKMDDPPSFDKSSATETSAPRRRAALWLRRAEFYYGLALFAFAVLALFAHINAYFGWDLRAARMLQNITLPGLLTFMRAVSFFGDGLNPYVLTIVTVIAFLCFGRRSEAAGLLASAGGSAALNTLLKLLIARPRPDADLVRVVRTLNSNSFPSGHVTFYVCYFGFLFFVAAVLLPRRDWIRYAALIALAAPVVLIGFSRVYLGAHWPSDTLGAYLTGGLWLALSLDLYRRWKARATFYPNKLSS